MNKLIDRNEYMDKLKKFKDQNLIKIITGVRRCGKSILLKLFKNYLLNNGVLDDQIISVNFEDMDYAYLKDPEKLHEYVKNNMVKDKKIIFFLMKYNKLMNLKRLWQVLI